MSHLNAVDNHKLMAPIKLWHECVQAVDGCYFDPACQASAIDAHALSEAWLKHALANAAGRVYGFTRGKGLPGEMYGLLLAREEAEELDRKQRQALPEPVRVGKATVAKFCCCVHDRKFNPIDELDVRSTLTPSDLDEHCWNLMFHRAVIRQLHRDTAFKVYRRELRRRYPGQSFPWDDNLRWDRNSVANLQWPRDVLLFALDTAGEAPWRVQHIVLPVQGTPQVAGCGAGSQGRDTWGFTVVPHAGGHLVAFHYCIGHPLPLVPAPQVARDAWADVIGDAAGSPRELTPRDGVALRISRFLLVHCKEVCLAPAAWCNWDEGKQNAIRDLFFSNITGGRFGGLPPDVCRDINLFD